MSAWRPMGRGSSVGLDGAVRARCASLRRTGARRMQLPSDWFSGIRGILRRRP